jgi:hypothetical protein
LFVNLVDTVAAQTGLTAAQIASQSMFVSHETYTPARGGSRITFGAAAACRTRRATTSAGSAPTSSPTTRAAGSRRRSTPPPRSRWISRPGRGG